MSSRKGLSTLGPSEPKPTSSSLGPAASSKICLSTPKLYFSVQRTVEGGHLLLLLLLLLPLLPRRLLRIRVRLHLIQYACAPPRSLTHPCHLTIFPHVLVQEKAESCPPPPPPRAPFLHVLSLALHNYQELVICDKEEVEERRGWESAVLVVQWGDSTEYST